MKKMETWFWIAVSFVAFGALIGVIGSTISAVITKMKNDESTANQEKIIGLNESIDSAVGRVEKLNLEIEQSTERLECIALESSMITASIESSQKILKALNQETKKTVEKIKDLQDGGDTYCRFWLDFFEARNTSRGKDIYVLFIAINGQNRMRNVSVSLSVNQGNKEEKGPLKLEAGDLYNLKVNYNGLDRINADLGDLKPYMVEHAFLSFDAEDYKNGYFDFQITIESENYNLSQRLIVFDLNKGLEYQKVYSVLTIQNGERAGEVLFKQITNDFPLMKEGGPDLKAINKLIKD